MLPGLVLQWMTTKKPDQGQIEVAIAALERIVELEPQDRPPVPGRRGDGVKPRPRWGPLPWFVLVLTLLMFLLVVVLPPLVLDKTPPAWVLRNADRVARWHGDPEPISAEWFETTRGEAWDIMTSTSGVAEPSPSPEAVGHRA